MIRALAELASSSCRCRTKSQEVPVVLRRTNTSTTTFQSVKTFEQRLLRPSRLMSATNTTSASIDPLPTVPIAISGLDSAGSTSNITTGDIAGMTVYRVGLVLLLGVAFTTRTQCEGEATDKKVQKQQKQEQQLCRYSNPSWLRRTLVSWKIMSSLPIPRLLYSDDPDLVLMQKHLKQRRKDEIQLRTLVQGGMRTLQQQQNNLNQQELVELQKEINEKVIKLTFGVDFKTRQEFLGKYGCTGWTEEVLDALVQLGKNRGIVEMGAGNGQWAKAISDHYKKNHNESSNSNNDTLQQFHFVLAYDNMSDIPLKQPRKPFFFPVENCSTATAPGNNNGIASSSSSNMNVLKDQKCRGRVLLIVYPSPGDNMAIDAVRSYVEAGDENDTIVYVGEGRGGFNANDDFFDYFCNYSDTDGNGGSTRWILDCILNVQPLGNKGYEKLFIFRKCKTQNNK